MQQAKRQATNRRSTRSQLVSDGEDATTKILIGESVVVSRDVERQSKSAELLTALPKLRARHNELLEGAARILEDGKCTRRRHAQLEFNEGIAPRVRLEHLGRFARAADLVAIQMVEVVDLVDEVIGQCGGHRDG